jgi:hypothetical protein
MLSQTEVSRSGSTWIRGSTALPAMKNDAAAMTSEVVNVMLRAIGALTVRFQDRLL